MKKIKFTCNSCLAKLRVPTHLAGVSAPCPKCGAMITAPTDISGAVDEDLAVRRSASSENPRARQSAYSTTSGGVQQLPVSLAAPAVGATVSTSEIPDHPPVRQTRPVQPVPNGNALGMEREMPVPIVETQSITAPVTEPEEPYVVVEVFNVPIEEPPPLSPITQPIQVNQRSGFLPEVRNETSVSPSPLPRLDVSLAGQEANNLSSIIFSDQGGQPGRMVVKLPQPGAEVHQFDPNDFIVPVAVRESQDPDHYVNSDEVEMFHDEPVPPAFEDGLQDMEDELPPIPLDEIEIPSFEETLPPVEDPGTAIAEGQSADEMIFTDHDEQLVRNNSAGEFDWAEGDMTPVKQSAVASELPWNVQTSSGRSEEPGHRTLSTDWQSMDTQPIPTLGALNVKRSDDAGELHPEDLEGGALHEGSMGNLFAQQPGIRQSPAGKQVSAPPFQTVASAELRNEGEVLDELFGTPPAASKGLSKTAVVMLCGIGGAAVIATVVVILLINLMGGLDPQAAYLNGTETAGPVIKETGPVAPVLLEEPSIDGAPPVIDPVAMLREEAAPASPPAGTGTGQETNSGASEVPETPALSFDERVARVVNGTDPLAKTEPVAKMPVLDPVDSAINSFKGATADGPPAEAPENPATAEGSSPAVEGTSANYNPPTAFPAPGPDEVNKVRNTNALIDAFLRAPDWESRIKFTYQGESLRSAIGDYYGKWADKKIDRFSVQLFQMEETPALGGPFWVYLVSTSDLDQGFPLIIRVEDGNLKVDWEIYAEFFDRHFVRFRDGKTPGPATFRVVVERVSDYYGSDREGFTDLSSYNVYQINPPYGELNEFSEYAFVKKDSEVAKKLDAVVGLNDEPLAVIVSLDEKAFDHGVKHYLITEYVTEGWFR